MENLINYKEEIGKFIQSKRTAKRHELEDISQEFRVRVKDLELFEKGEEMHSSNPSFSRLLALKYAKKLEIEKDEEFIELLDNAYPKVNLEFTQVIPEIDNMSFQKNIKKKDNKRVVKRVLTYFISLCFLLLLVGSLLFLFTKNIQSVSDDVKNETTLLTEQKLKPTKVVKEIPKTTVEFVEKTVVNGTNTLVYDITAMDPKDTYSVTIEVLDDCVVTVYDNNWKKVQDKTYAKKGDVFTIDFENMNQVNITVDQVQNVKVKVNDTDIDIAKQEKEGYYLIRINNKVE